jgi:hypothetical protein
MKYLAGLIFIGLSFTGKCFFEIKLNQVSVYNSSSATEQVLNMEYDSLEETDLFEINYTPTSVTSRNDYELHVKVENTTVDLTFINDLPTFTLNMGWFTQFKNRKATIYLYHTWYNGSTVNEQVHKIVDLFIA